MVGVSSVTLPAASVTLMSTALLVEEKPVTVTLQVVGVGWLISPTVAVELVMDMVLPSSMLPVSTTLSWVVGSGAWSKVSAGVVWSKMMLRWTVVVVPASLVAVTTMV